MTKNEIETISGETTKTETLTFVDRETKASKKDSLAARCAHRAENCDYVKREGGQAENTEKHEEGWRRPVGMEVVSRPHPRGHGKKNRRCRGAEAKPGVPKMDRQSKVLPGESQIEKWRRFLQTAADETPPGHIGPRTSMEGPRRTTRARDHPHRYLARGQKIPPRLSTTADWEMEGPDRRGLFGLLEGGDTPLPIRTPLLGQPRMRSTQRHQKPGHHGIHDPRPEL